MTSRVRWAALAAVSWLAGPPALAQPAAGCFDSVRVDPQGASARDLVAVTFEGVRKLCSSVRVAAIGDRETLGQPFDHELNIVVAVRNPSVPGLVCPEPGEVPYTLVAHLPQTLAQSNPHDGPHVIGLFLRDEDASGKLLSLRECGELGVFIDDSSRDVVVLHEGRFAVSVTWKTGGRQGLGRIVPPVHDPPADAALFWFFEPENWELLVKVIDGCALNGHWWLLGAAATDVEYTLRVTDTVTGSVWTHHNPPGILAPAFADAFAGCAAAGSLP